MGRPSNTPAPFDQQDPYTEAIAGFLNDLSRVEEGVDYARYYDDPVGFGEEVLGESYTDDVKRLMESVRDFRVTVAISATGTGKSHSAARVASWFYKSHKNAQVYTCAAPPEKNLRTILWGELGNIIHNFGDTLFKDDHITDLNIGAKNDKKSFITGVTIPMTGSEKEREGRFSGKHAPNMLFICDEGDAIPEAVYKGIEGCMSGGIRVRLLIMFNPRNESGYVARLIQEGKANVVELSAFRHPNVVTGEHVIPGAVDRDTTVRRINEWTIPLGEGEKPDSECFEVPEYLVGTVAKTVGGNAEYPPLPGGWRRIMESQFSYMVLGKYPAAGEGQLISRAWINAARARWDSYVAANGIRPPEGVQPILGLDVAEFGPDFNVLTRRYGGFVMPQKKWNGLDPLETADKAADAYFDYNALMVCVDGTGVGAGVAPQMERRGCSDVYGVKVSEKPTFEVEFGRFFILRDQLFWLMREWLRRDPGAMLPPDKDLIEELATPTYEVVNGKIKIMDKKTMKGLLGHSPDSAESLLMTFFNEAIESEDVDGPLAQVLGARGV